MSHENKVNNGNWITLFRDIERHWIYKNNLYFSAWVKILLSANHSFNRVLIKGQLIDCDRGQSVKALSTWAKDLGKEWSVQKVRTFFKLLVNESMIETESVNISTRLTICNYDTYQPLQQVNNKQTTSKQQANNKQATTNNKDKKDKKGNNKETVLSVLEDAYKSMSDKRKDAIKDWVEYRKELKKPLKTVLGTKAFLNEIERDYADDDFLARSIAFTKSKEWQGLKPSPVSNKTNSQSLEEMFKCN